MATNGRSGTASAGSLDAVVVGAGFAGLHTLFRLRELGLAVRVFEAGSGVGGTWFWNRYPGARCDVESLDYSYSFSNALQQEWDWTERYASQPEIQRYLQHVADRFDLWRDIVLDTRVTAVRFDESEARWLITTERHQQVSASFVILATGCLSTPRVPDLPGATSFQGTTYHTGYWPGPVTFTGQRVGVIGTGSSGVQITPILAEEAERLWVFQRTPAYSLPAHNGPLRDETQQEAKASYGERRNRVRHTRLGLPLPPDCLNRSAFDVSADERQRVYQRLWDHGGLALVAAFSDLLTDRAANDTVAEFIRGKIREIVHDSDVARRLSPTYPFGAKRPCIDSGYYRTFNRDNVELVDVRESPIIALAPSGIRTTAADYKLDSVVFATGFDAMTGAISRIDIRGRNGQRLRDKWEAGPRAYLGLTMAGFPNLFVVTGPGSPSVLSNMVVSIEQHVEWIGDLINYMQIHGYHFVEPKAEAENEWVAHVNDLAKRTLYYSTDSWYLGANVPGKPRVFMPYVAGVEVYRNKCDAIAAGEYVDMDFSRSDTPFVTTALGTGRVEQSGDYVPRQGQ